jgi:hypothetical protein
MFLNFIYIIYELRVTSDASAAMQSTFLFLIASFFFQSSTHQQPSATESSQRYLSSVQFFLTTKLRVRFHLKKKRHKKRREWILLRLTQLDCLKKYIFIFFHSSFLPCQPKQQYSKEWLINRIVKLFG